MRFVVVVGIWAGFGGGEGLLPLGLGFIDR